MTTPKLESKELPLLLRILLFPFTLLIRLLRWLLGPGPDPVVIVSPQNGDTVGESFAVSGTYLTGNTVTVTISGGSSGNATASPDFDVPFSVTITGTSWPCTATATATGASQGTASFTVSTNPPITLSPPTPIQVPPGPPPTPAASLNSKIAITGLCKAATVTAFLDKVKGANLQQSPPIKVVADRYSYTFNAVGSGLYLVRVSAVVGGKTVHTSRWVLVR